MKFYFSTPSITVFLCAIGGSCPTSAVEGVNLTLKACSELTAEINKNVPMAIDQHTTLETTFCTPGKTKPTLNYRAVMGGPKSKINDIEGGLKKMRSQQLNSWCTDPEQVKVIRMADVKNIYYDVNHVYVGEIDLRSADCKLIN